MDEKLDKYLREGAPRKRTSPFQPLLFALMLVVGIFIGTNLGDKNIFVLQSSKSEDTKLMRLMKYIDNNYVDDVDKSELIDAAIRAILEELDPHSYYVSAEEFAAAQEPMEGNFEGIGVEFMIQRDTLVVVSPIEGGPSEAAGIQPGDRIVEVEGEPIAGIGLSNTDVMKLLKGAKGTKVNIGIERVGENKLLQFTIVRDKIPIYSVTANFMLTPETGYVKVVRFAKNTYEEFTHAIDSLRSKGANKLVIDLRGNGGGYLNSAVPMVEEFVEKGELIVYTQGKSSARRDYRSSIHGHYKDMQVAVLINEGSASASEIMAGALQDLDLATIVGRRSFGKGLVQEERPLDDSSSVRLTVARYYTPSGRCIQREYGKGINYEDDMLDRIDRGELMSADSIKFPEDQKFSTRAGRTVYGGGGIMPDVFVPVDTSNATRYLSDLIYDGIIRQWAFSYTEKNRSKLNYASVDDLMANFAISADMMDALVAYAKAEGITPGKGELNRSRNQIALRVKAFVARNLFNENAYFRVVAVEDADIMKALEVLGGEQ